MIIVLMGVSGSGKTTTGKKLAKKLDCPFYDADDFHSPANKKKMSKGIALTDEDRRPWLLGLAEEMKKWDQTHPKSVFACSALKREYRYLLSKDVPVRWVYLKGEKELIRRRLESRENHFMKPELLETQFRDLEEPDKAIVIDINSEWDRMVEDLFQKLKET